MRVILLCLLAGVLGSSVAGGQSLSDIPVSSTVRLTYRPLPNEEPSRIPKPVVGQFASQYGDSLFLFDAARHDTTRYRLTSLARVEYSVRRDHPRASATLIGTLAGGIAGFLYGRARSAAPASLCTDPVCPPVSSAAKRRGAGQVALIGAGIGLLGGFATGATVSVDRWVTVYGDR